MLGSQPLGRRLRIVHLTAAHVVASIGYGARWMTFALAIFLALGAVAGSIWLQRKITPPLLTPENAASVYETPEPRQPGEAPPA